MKRHQLLMCGAIALSVLALAYSTSVTSPTVTAAPAPAPVTASPLFHFYQDGSDYHFYTADDNERAKLKKQPEWTEYPSMGYVFRQKAVGTVPLYRLAKDVLGSKYFYTINQSEADNAAQNLGWKFEGIACYVSETQVPGTVAFYRLYKPLTPDGVEALKPETPLEKLSGAGKKFHTGPYGDGHYYTINEKEKDFAANNGYQFVRIEAYVWTKAESLPAVVKGEAAPPTATGVPGPATQSQIEQSYQESFGRASTPSELAYWVAQVKAHSYSYKDLIKLHRQWLMTNAARPERTGVVNRSYYEVFGLYPTPDGDPKIAVGGMNQWTDTVAAAGANYTDLVATYRDWLLGGSMQQNTVLAVVIKHAYSFKGLGSPTDAQLKDWMAKAITQQLTFKQIVAMLPKPPGGFPKLPGKQP